jgi:hypothetical protein
MVKGFYDSAFKNLMICGITSHLYFYYKNTILLNYSQIVFQINLRKKSEKQTIF